jgi:hypothetical protein
MTTLELVVDNSREIATEALTWPERARAIAVTSPETYSAAAELLKGIKALRGRIAETFDPHIRRAHEAHKALVRQKADMEAPLTEAETTVKRALGTYTQEQERIRREEERRLAEEARKREEERRLAEAAALETEAAETGNAELLAEAQEMISAPVEAPVVILQSATPKVAGISYRENWKGACTDLAALVKAAAVRPELLSLLKPNDTAINQMARAQKGRFSVPGCKAWNEPIVASRGA